MQQVTQTRKLITNVKESFHRDQLAIISDKTIFAQCAQLARTPAIYIVIIIVIIIILSIFIVTALF